MKSVRYEEEDDMNMKKVMYLLILALVPLMLWGCGSSSESKTGSTGGSLTASQPDFPNAILLVSAGSVQENLGSRDLVIIDARVNGYDLSHIPGAVNIKHSDYWTKGSGLKDTATIANQLGAAGITRDRKIVIYDDTTASWGAAGRIFWMLEYLGCTDVHIIDGGWDKWIAEGRPTESNAASLPAATFTPQVDAAKKATSGHISYRLFDNDFALIDSRADEEFMGWQLYGETRGGHIPRAVNIPYEWFFNSDKSALSFTDLKGLFESRGITPDKEVSAYCTAGIRSGYVYFLLRLMGYSRSSNYDASIWDWADNTTLAMEKAANYATVVYPAWVKTLIDYHRPGSTTPPPPQYPYDRGHRYLIFETQWGSIEDMQQGWADNSYLLGHIPGAIHSNSDTYENNYPRWFLLPDAELKAAVGSMGITADTTVVVYSSSNIFAARLWWILKYAGVTDVRMMNGGMAQWGASGYPVETTINYPVPVTFSGTTSPRYLATTDYVAANFNSGSTQLVDVRTGSEYAGIISGYSYLAAKGRIPNAIWAYDADDSSPVYHDSDGTLRSFTEIRDMWSGLGIKSTGLPTRFDREVIFYCGGGYRSSLTYLYAYLMGFENIRNYSDGWAGWSTKYTEDPACTGITPGWCQDPSGRPFETGWPSGMATIQYQLRGIKAGAYHKQR